MSFREIRVPAFCDEDVARCEGGLGGSVGCAVVRVEAFVNPFWCGSSEDNVGPREIAEGRRAIGGQEHGRQQDVEK